MPDGSRVHAILPPLAPDGPCLTIRRFGANVRPLADFIDDRGAKLLRVAVEQKKNVVVTGATGAGKTTLLNSLAAFISQTERVVTIEDTAELRLAHNHVVRLESRLGTGEGVAAVAIRDLLRHALRMRPDRIVVGEVRGAEALDMIQAMNTGHSGSLTTCHANTCTDALRRLETMALFAAVGLPLQAVREQLATTIDIVVQVSRYGAGRRITEIADVVGVDDTTGLIVVRAAEGWQR